MGAHCDHCGSRDSGARAMIRRDVRERTVAEEVIVEVTCDDCGKRLEPVFADTYNEAAQCKGMLTLTLNGGYGEFIDGSAQFQLCKACADHLLKLWPGIRKELEDKILL